MRSMLLPLFFAGIASIHADSRTPVTITVPVLATVADVVASTIPGHTGFNIPLAPQFTSRSLFRNFPKGMKEYPALVSLNVGIVTTAAMIRFINQSSSLFTNKTERALYQKALNGAIAAHKRWYSSRKPDDLKALHTAEDATLEYLKNLKLSDAATKKKLETILSTPSSIMSKGKKVLTALLTTPSATIDAQLKTDPTTGSPGTKFSIKPNVDYRPLAEARGSRCRSAWNS